MLSPGAAGTMSILFETIRSLLHSDPSPRAKGDAGRESASSRVIELDQVNSLVAGKHGWFLANRFDHFIGESLIRYGEFSEIEHEFLRTLVGPGDSVIEVGSNIGAHTVGMARHIGPAGQLFAIEPQPAIFQVLCANLALNSLRYVRPLMHGCGSTPGKMYVHDVDYSASTVHNSGSMSLRQDAAGIPVSVVRVDDLAADIEDLRLMKIDVEGMEADVIESARDLIRKHRPILYVENDRREKSSELIQLISALGYRLWWHVPALYSASNYFLNPDNVYGNIVSINMVCQPAERADESLVTDLREVLDPADHPMDGW